MASLLEDLRDHLLAGLVPLGFPVPQFRLHQFTDADLQGAAPVLVLRRSGSGGLNDHVAQATDVDVVGLFAPDKIKDGENVMLSLIRFLKSPHGFEGDGAFGYVVYSRLIGPNRMENGRQRFAFIVGVFTEIDN